MLRETTRSLRLWFAIVTVLNLVIWAGMCAEVLLVLRRNPHADLSLLYLARLAFIFVVALAYGYVWARFASLIRSKPAMILAVLHVTYWGSLAFAVVYVWYGTGLNFIGLLISTLIYVYLWKSVVRLSTEQPSKGAPNNPPEATPGQGSSVAPSSSAGAPHL